MNKKIIYFIAGLIFIGLIIWFVFYINNNVMTGATVRPSAVAGIKAFGPALDDNNNVVYYDLDNADLYRYDPATQIKTKLSQDMDQPSKIIWSPDGSQAIIKIEYNKYNFEKFNSPFVNKSVADGTVMLWHYNLNTNKYIMLSQDIFAPASDNPLNPVWSADSKSIVYYSVDQTTKIKSLKTSNPDGTNPRTIGTVSARLFSILKYDSASGTVLYSTSNVNDDNSISIYQLNLATQQEKTIIENVSSVGNFDNLIFYTKDNKSYIYDDQSGKTNKISIDLAANNFTYNVTSGVLISLGKNKSKQAMYLIKLQNLKPLREFELDFGDKQPESIENLALTKDAKKLLFTSGDNLFSIPIE